MDIAKHTTTFGLDEDRSWLGSRHGTEATRSGTLDVSTLTAGTHFASGGGVVKSGTALALNGSSGLWEPYSADKPVNEQQTFTRTSTGGTITVTVDGETTGTIAATAAGFTAAALKTALEATAAINPGDVSVSGSAGGPLVVTFTGDRAGEDIPAMTVDNGSATGGTITVAQTTAGAAGTGSALGILFSSVAVTGTDAADAPIAILEQGFIVESLLPTNHGVDAAFKVAAPLIHFR